jgi:hypothetical protein
MIYNEFVIENRKMKSSQISFKDCGTRLANRFFYPSCVHLSRLAPLVPKVDTFDYKHALPLRLDMEGEKYCADTGR